MNGSVTPLDSLDALTGSLSLTSVKVLNQNIVAATPLEGVCPPNDSSIEIAVSGLKFNVSCQNGLFSSAGDLSPLTEGTHSVTLKSVPSGTSSSATLLRDDTKPTAPTGLSTAAFVASLTLAPEISWVESSDSLSGVDHYEVRLLKSSDSSVVASWTQLNSGGTLGNLSDGTNGKAGADGNVGPKGDPGVSPFSYVDSVAKTDIY